MTENKGKNGKILLKYVICAVVLAVLAEFMMILDYEGLMGAYWNKNQQLTLSLEDASLTDCELQDGKIVVTGENPQMVFEGINEYVSNVQIGLHNLSYSALDTRIYYSIKGERFAKKKSVQVSYPENQKFVSAGINSKVTSFKIAIEDN